MEVLWTTVSFAVFSVGIVLTAYILFRWLGSARH